MLAVKAPKFEITTSLFTLSDNVTVELKGLDGDEAHVSTQLL